jgi:hypothetical protein
LLWIIIGCQIRVMEINNSTIWRRMWVRRQGASTDAYRDMCRWMERRWRNHRQARCGIISFQGP